MLQHNTKNESLSRRTHWAHAAVVALHTVCCGIPAFLAITGAAMWILSWASGPVASIHGFIHGYEAEVTALSFILVVVGGALEWHHRAGRKGIPKLYALSLICFFANISLIAAHRLPTL